MDGPNYMLIINETSALRKLQVAQPGRVSQQVFYWTENRIHKEEHAERIRTALRRWGRREMLVDARRWISGSTVRSLRTKRARE